MTSTQARIARGRAAETVFFVSPDVDQALLLKLFSTAALSPPILHRYGYVIDTIFLSRTARQQQLPRNRFELLLNSSTEFCAEIDLNLGRILETENGSGRQSDVFRDHGEEYVALRGKSPIATLTRGRNADILYWLTFVLLLHLMPDVRLLVAHPTVEGEASHCSLTNAFSQARHLQDHKRFPSQTSEG